MANPEMQRRFNENPDAKLPPKAHTKTKKADWRGKLASSPAQAFLDGTWHGLRTMYIWIARHFGMEQEMFACESCGRFAPPRGYGYRAEVWGECDHIVPRSKSGHYRPDNMRWVCAGPRSCHEDKHGAPAWSGSQ